MKKLLFAILALSGSASAQQVHLETFRSDRSSSFRMLVPGASVEAEPSAVEQAIDNGSSGFANDSANMSWEASNEALADVVPAAPYVPDWMRAGRPKFDHALQRHTAYFPDPDCLTSGYFPRYGMSSDAESRRRLYFHDILTAACDAGVPVKLFDALVWQESRYRPFARSHVGAMGLSQLMPGTARGLGVSDPWDVRQNLSGGARYLRQQLDRFGSWELALAAYNAGPGRVQQFNGIPPFRETRNYVATIMATIDKGATPQAIGSVVLAANPFRKVQLAFFSRPSQIPEY